MAAVLLAAVFACLSGCVSLEGARLYRDGTAALDRGDPGVAVSLLEQAAERLPQASEVQNHLGLAYAATGRHQAALAAWRRALELDCDNAAARYNLRTAERRILEASGAGAGVSQ